VALCSPLCPCSSDCIFILYYFASSWTEKKRFDWIWFDLGPKTSPGRGAYSVSAGRGELKVTPLSNQQQLVEKYFLRRLRLLLQNNRNTDEYFQTRCLKTENLTAGYLTRLRHVLGLRLAHGCDVFSIQFTINYFHLFCCILHGQLCISHCIAKCEL